MVATPIGNLGDITLRALEVLRSRWRSWPRRTPASRCACGRATASPRTWSATTRRARPARQAELLARLAAGEDVALVTDAGTPLVSDPGEGLVGAWAAAGGRRGPHPRPLRGARGTGRERHPGTTLGVRGVPAPQGRGAARAAGPDRRATTARRCCSRRPGAPRPRCATWRRRVASIARPRSAGSSPSGTRRSVAGRWVSWPRRRGSTGQARSPSSSPVPRQPR